MLTQNKNSKSNIKLVPTNNKKRFTVQLNLPSEKRYIGYLDTSGDGTYFTERKRKHIYRKYNSFGVSYDLIHNPNIDFKWIIIHCEDKEYVSTREYFREKGKISNFTNKGFELQLHVPIDELNHETIEQFEKTHSVQLNFFQKDERSRDYGNA